MTDLPPIEYTEPTWKQQAQIESWKQRQLNAKWLEKIAGQLREEPDADDD